MIGREHQHFHRFIVLVLQYGGYDVMWKLFLGEKKREKGSGIQVSPDQFGIEQEPA